MSVIESVEHPVATPALPRSIWVVAWASLAGQAVLLVGNGVRLGAERSIPLSIVLGALLMAYVCAGVVRARTVRLAIAWVVLALSFIAESIGLFPADDAGRVVLNVLVLASTTVALAGMAFFRRTDWYAWQRTKPSVHEGVPIAQVVVIGVLVGVLGGIVGPVDDHGFDLRINVSER